MWLDRIGERDEERTNLMEIGIIRIITDQLRENQPPRHASHQGKGEKTSTSGEELGLS